MNIFTIHESLFQNLMKILLTIFQNKTKQKFQEKVASSRFHYQKREFVLTVHKLFEHDFWQN